MLIAVHRLPPLPQCTLGGFYIDGAFECFTLEDLPHTPKIAGETRIPAGVYQVLLQTSGRVHSDYLVRFPGVHKGVLALQSVPNFLGVLIHIGNTDKDTEGCILVGDEMTGGKLIASEAAYLRMYKKVLAAIEADDEVTITVGE